ncbi:MAG: phosphoribosylformylglycinamidine synthase subunit PurS [Nitrososphaerales archaeon]
MKEKFLVYVTIEGKPMARDPEGETIHRVLLAKSRYNMVKSVRVAKLLKMIVEAESEDEAERIVTELCDNLRLYNPAAHKCSIKVNGRIK